jgi:hypothetical protein
MPGTIRLREVLASNELHVNSSLRELMRQKNVRSLRGLVGVLTPRWDTIRGAFTEEDHWHMLYGSEESGPIGSPMDLGDYEDVRRNAPGIYERVTTPDEELRMPPYPRPRWSASLTLLFRRWMAGGMPR